LQLTKKSML